MNTIEKMARAMYQRDVAAGRVTPEDALWETYVDLAVAALESLREPSEGMMAAAETAMDNIPRTGVVPENTERALDGFVAAIDFALSESREE